METVSPEAKQWSQEADDLGDDIIEFITAWSIKRKGLSPDGKAIVNPHVVISSLISIAGATIAGAPEDWHERMFIHAVHELSKHAGFESQCDLVRMPDDNGTTH